MKRNYNRRNLDKNRNKMSQRSGGVRFFGLPPNLGWALVLCLATFSLRAASAPGGSNEENFSLDAEEPAGSQAAPYSDSEAPPVNVGTSANSVPANNAIPVGNAVPSANGAPSAASTLPLSNEVPSQEASPNGNSGNSSVNPVEAPPENIQQPADVQTQQSATPSAQSQGAQPKGQKPPAQQQQAGEKLVAPLPDEIVGSEFGPKVPAVSGPNEFGGIPVVTGTRKILARDEAPERYSVESGDTLYDICDQLLDEPNYWPKLWSLNPFIKNPHFIYPGMQLMFHSGDEETPPFLQVLTEDDVVPIDKANLVESELVKEDISKLLSDSAMPGATQVIGPQDISAEIQVPFETWGNTFSPNHLDVTIPAFIFKDEHSALGTIVGGEKGKFLSTTAEMVVIKANDQLLPGTTYTVLREGDKVRTHNNNDYVGLRYEFIAHVNLNEKLDDDLYNAKVTFDRLGIKAGDILVPYISTARKVPTGNISISKRADSSEVVAFGYPKNELGGKGSVVMLANNEASQLSEGDVVGIYHVLSRTVTSFLKNDLPENKKLIAVVYIFANTEAVSLGYVVQAQIELALGDTANLNKTSM